MSGFGSPPAGQHYGGGEYQHAAMYGSPQYDSYSQQPGTQPGAHPSGAYQGAPGIPGGGAPPHGGYGHAGYPGGSPSPYAAVRTPPLPEYTQPRKLHLAHSITQQDGYAPPGYGPGYGVPPGAPAPDMQRLWDLSQLQYKLSEMQHHVAVTDEGFQHREAAASGAVDSTGGSEHGGVPADGSLAAALALPGAYDFTRLPISEGYINRKGGSDSGFRVWKQKYMRLDGAELSFAARAEDKPQSRFKLDGRSTVSPGECAAPYRCRLVRWRPFPLSAGDPLRAHKNKAVKFDFDLKNGDGEVVSFYCNEEAEAQAWMFSLQFVISKLAEVRRGDWWGGGGKLG